MERLKDYPRDIGNDERNIFLEDIISKMDLEKDEVLAIVRRWYLVKNPFIIQDEDGRELDEVCEFELKWL